MMQFVCDLFVDRSLRVDYGDNSIQFRSPHDSEEFLESLFKEACDKGIVDALHNKYINVIQGESTDESSSHSEDESDGKGKREKLFVPSLLFIFPDERKTCQSALFAVDHSLLHKRVQVECILFSNGNAKLYDTLKMLQRISEYQDVSAKTFTICDIYTIPEDPVGDEGTVDPTSLLLEMIKARVGGSNENDDSSVVQFLELCQAIMSSESDTAEITQTLNYMVTNVAENIATDPTVQVIKDAIRPKLNFINKAEIPDSVRSLRKLFIETFKISRFATDILVVDCILHSQVMKHLVDQLRGCKNLRKLVLSPLEFPDNFDDIISFLSSLETVVLSGTLEHANGCLLAGLSHPHMLNVLSINGCTLSGQVLHLFGDQDHPGFVQLKALLMVDTKLDKVDLKGICTAVSNDKLPLLWVLDLSGNVLTDCLADLLGGSGEPRFLCLAHLCLSNTKLSKRDMDSFASAVNYCKLPAIESVDLSDNVLTDIMSTLVGQTDYPGFRSLTHLKVTNCKLSTSDVKCAMAALRLGKLPNLGTLEDFPQVSHEWLSDFLITNHPAGPEVVSLDLEKKGLSGADMKAISDAAKQGKFNQLKEINLSENTLTNCLSDLFGSSDRPGFPSLYCSWKTRS